MEITTQQILILIAIGFFGGLISGTFGVGGGIVIIPALVFFMGVTQHKAQGIYLGMVTLPVFIFASYNYYKSGNFNFKYSLLLLGTFVIGSFLGSYLSNNYISDKTLQKIFGVLMLLTSLKIIFSK